MTSRNTQPSFYLELGALVSLQNREWVPFRDLNTAGTDSSRNGT